MSEIDEPALGSKVPGSHGVAGGETVENRVRRLIDGQHYAVLCTQADEQPYGGLVAYAFSTGLCQAAFALPSTTRKYHQLLSCPRLSLVIDDRATQTSDLMAIEAVTATGLAIRLEMGSERDAWLVRLSERHSYMGGFFSSPSCALFLIDIVRFFHVGRFQEVSEWVPDQTG
jgi:hypothetical protein